MLFTLTEKGRKIIDLWKDAQLEKRNQILKNGKDRSGGRELPTYYQIENELSVYCENEAYSTTVYITENYQSDVLVLEEGKDFTKEKVFTNTDQLFNDDGELDFWTEDEVKKYYEDLKKNNEYNVSHTTFDEWLINQGQFEEFYNTYFEHYKFYEEFKSDRVEICKV